MRIGSYEESIEILNYCLKHENNFIQGVEVFNISNMKVYQ